MAVCISVFTVSLSFSLWIWLANIALFVWIYSACPPISFMFCGWCKLCAFSQDSNRGNKDLRQGWIPSLNVSLLTFAPLWKPVFYIYRTDFHTNSYSSWWPWGGFWAFFFCTLPAMWFWAGLSLTIASFSVAIPVLRVGHPLLQAQATDLSWLALLFKALHRLAALFKILLLHVIKTAGWITIPSCGLSFNALLSNLCDGWSEHSPFLWLSGERGIVLYETLR